MTEMMTYDFEVTQVAPPTKKRGGPGAPRRNQFDEPVKRSHDAGWYLQTEEHPQGQWYKLTVPRKDIPKVEARIRNAASYQQLGSYVRNDDHELPADATEGHVWFTGKPLEAKHSNGAGSTGTENGDTENGDTGTDGENSDLDTEDVDED